MHINDPHLTDIEAIEAAARIYLDVNPEGTLLREAHDITDELRMMTRIYCQQLRIAKYFSKTLQDLNEKESPLSSRELLQGLKRTLEDMSSRQTGSSLDGHMNGFTHHADEKGSKVYRPIPDSTLNRARNFLEDIEIRLTELQDLEENTKDITEHVRLIHVLRKATTNAY